LEEFIVTRLALAALAAVLFIPQGAAAQQHDEVTDTIRRMCLAEFSNSDELEARSQCVEDATDGWRGFRTMRYDAPEIFRPQIDKCETDHWPYWDFVYFCALEVTAKIRHVETYRALAAAQFGHTMAERIYDYCQRPPDYDPRPSPNWWCIRDRIRDLGGEAPRSPYDGN